MTEVKRILSTLERKEGGAAAELVAAVYKELRQLAASKVAQENSNGSLQATDLVHEAYLRLVDVDHQQRWDSRGHFFAAAATAMRRVLVDRARKRKAIKRGGDRIRISINDAPSQHVLGDPELLRLDEALERLTKLDPAKAKLIELRFFASRTIEQTAELLGISPATAKRQWRVARAWLLRELDKE